MPGIDEDLNPVSAAGKGLWDWFTGGWQQRRAADEASAAAVRAGVPADVAAQRMAAGQPAVPTPSAAVPPQAPAAPAPMAYPGAAPARAPMVQGPQYARVPAQEVPMVAPARQLQSQETADTAEEAVRATAEAAGEKGQAEAGVPLAQAAGLSNEAQANRDIANKYVQNTVDRAKGLREFRQKIDRMSEKAASIKEEDPYDSLSGWDRVRFALAGALGGFAEGFTHGAVKNRAPDMIHARIADEVARQRRDYEKAKGRVTDLNEQYAQAVQETGSLDAADRLMAAHYLEGAKKETDALVAAAQSPVAAANGAMLQRDLEAKQAQMAHAHVGEQIGMNKYIPAHTVAVGGGLKPIKDEDRKLLVRMPGGATVKANSEKEAEDLRGQIKSDVRITDLIDQAMALRAQGKQGVLPLEGKRQLQSIGNELILASKEPGVRFGEGERELLENIVGDIGGPGVAGFGNPATDTNLARMRGSRVQNAKSYVGGQALPVVELGYSRDPKTGQLVQTGNFTGENYGAPAELGKVPFTPAQPVK